VNTQHFIYSTRLVNTVELGLLKSHGILFLIKFIIIIFKPSGTVVQGRPYVLLQFFVSEMLLTVQYR